MKKYIHNASAGRRRIPLGATAGLFMLGLCGLGSCVHPIPESTRGEGVVALFNPGSVPSVLPAPTDLARVGGLLRIPVDPAEAENGALATFNTYLRSLDGFPPDSTATTTFSDAIDIASVPEGVVVYDATANVILTVPDAVPVLDPTSGSKRLVISTKSRWKNGHTYLVGLFSWTEGTVVHGLRGADAKPVIADSAFAFLRSPTAIYARCADASNPACACADLADSACHSVVDGLVNAQAKQLEVGRQGIKPIIDAVLALNGRVRSDLVMAFSFTISQRSFATFDAGRSQVPFPSNLLLSNQGMGDPLGDANVNLPILPTDDARTQALKGGLNTLDGFSTTGSVQFPIDSAMNGAVPVNIDPATVLPGKTALLLNLVPAGKQPSYTAAPLNALLDPTNNVSGFAGQVWVTPSSPLIGDRTTYAAVLTTAIKNAMGQPLMPGPVTLLITQGSPLVVNGASAIPSIPLSQAQQLEPLRLALAPLVAQFKQLGIAPSSIAAVTVYRTQGIVKPMLQLLAGTTALGAVIPSAVTINQTVPNPAMLPGVSALLYGQLTVRRVVELRGTFNPTGRLTPDVANNDVIPFVMTLPDPTKVLPAGSAAPVVIVQHGLARWRGDALAVASALGNKGLAMIAIDAIYHGDRAICLSDADCATGVTCTQPPPVGGVPQAGQCVGGAYLQSAVATEQPLPGTTKKLPDANLPRRDFTNLANPFAQRDNFRQHTLDLFQMVRVIKDVTVNGLSSQISAAALQRIDPAKIGYLGQSLGAMLGTSFLALTPSINIGVLNVGGGNLVGMFTDPNSLLSTGVATQLGVAPGTPAYYSLTESLRWIIDPADPINLARYVRTPDATLTPTRTPAKVILQQAGMDNVITGPFTQALGKELGLPLDAMGRLLGISGEGATPTNVSTYFATAGHGAIFDFINAALTTQIQNQAATYLATGLGGAAPTVVP